jgi:hypothetical protein
LRRPRGSEIGGAPRGRGRMKTGSPVRGGMERRHGDPCGEVPGSESVTVGSPENRSGESGGADGVVAIVSGGGAISELGVALLSTLCTLGNGGEQGAQGAQGSSVVPGTTFTWGVTCIQSQETESWGCE